MNEDLRHLAVQLVALRREARWFGLFANDRELLTCPTCGLMENVTIDGRLFTGRADALESEPGLRFEEHSPGCFDCPACGTSTRDGGQS